MANPAHLSARFRCAIPASELPPHFGIVTAFNPDDQIAPPDANFLADRALDAVIVRRGWPHFRVTGGDATFTHQEPGWGIVATQEDLLGLGREFRQVALFWITDGDLWLLDCNGPERVHLGTFNHRTAFPKA